MKKIALKALARIYGYLKSIYFLNLYNSYRSRFTLHETFRFNGENIIFYGGGKIEIDANSYIGWNSIIEAGIDCTVSIGANCSISHNVRVYTTSNDTNQNFDSSKPRIKRTGDVIIGNGVWIGVNVVINPGIKIGDNVVIGANSVVTKDVNSNSLVGGVPAKFIRFINVSV